MEFLFILYVFLKNIRRLINVFSKSANNPNVSFNRFSLVDEVRVVKEVGLHFREKFRVLSQKLIETHHRRVNQMLLLSVVKTD
jgi:hypothetical protein